MIAAALLNSRTSSMVRTKRLLNQRESHTDAQLQGLVAKWGARVFAKVRVADVLAIEGSGLADDDFSYALSAHFDFVVAEHDEPLFAIEFDGPFHRHSRQQERDMRKDRICEMLDFPILRINARYLDRDHGDITLLAWFVECWFVVRWLQEAQNNGSFPADEPILPTSMLHVPGYKEPFPLQLALKPRAEILAFHRAGKCLQPGSSHIIGRDAAGNYHALGYLQVRPDEWIAATTGMRRKAFPVVENEVLSEIIDYAVYRELLRYLAEGSHTLTGDELNRRVRDFNVRHELASSFAWGKGAA